MKSATYYSDDWVVNFWNSESSCMEEELAQIAADGFNSIILAVPWQEFQPQMEPVRYESYALEKMDRVMEAAERHGLWVILRLGYIWDYGNGSSADRYERLFYDGTVQNAWLDYVGKIYETAGSHSNFYGGFLTWEDFWNLLESSRSGGRSRAGIERAKQIGYQDSVRERYTIDQLKDQFGLDVDSYEDIWIPGEIERSFYVFYEFYDDFLNRMLRESQTVFPDLSMEVRLDVDPVPGEDGEKIGFSHAGTYGCQAAPYTCAMYSVSMGEDQGKEITAAEALKTMRELLSQVKAYNGGKSLYIDQLLYMDNTPGFEDNARLAEGERTAFLEGADGVLESCTMGYGIWTYRNYGNNALYNSQFALGEAGWDFDSGCKVVKKDGSMKAQLAVKNTISQDFSSRLGAGDTIKVRFQAKADGIAQIWVTIGMETKYITVSGDEDVYLEFTQGGNRITFSADREVWIDNVNVYTWETDGGLYGIDGQPAGLIPSMRILNQKAGN